MIDMELIDRWQGENRQICDILGDENIKMIFIQEILRRLPIPCLHEGAIREDFERREQLVKDKNELDCYQKRCQDVEWHLFDAILPEIQQLVFQAIAEHDREVMQMLEEIVNG